MVPTLQLPLKPWPDPPLVLQVLLDVYPVSLPYSRYFWMSIPPPLPSSRFPLLSIPYSVLYSRFPWMSILYPVP